MEVNEIQIIRPSELACEMTSTIAAQTFATCALDDYQLSDRFTRMGINIKPRDLIGSMDALGRMLGELTLPDSSLSKPAKLRLRQLRTLLNKIREHTYVCTTHDAWTSDDDSDDEEDDDDE